MSIREKRHYLTRGELFSMVWLEPISRVAPKYGISDVGLAKLCKRVKIPLPPRGYWTKLQHGKRVRNAVLKPIENPEKEKIVIIERQRKKVEMPDDIIAAIERESLRINLIYIPKKVRKWHQIIQKWIFEDKQRNFSLSTIGWRKNIDKKIEKRRCRILNAFLNALEQRGWSVSCEHRHKFFVKICGQQIEFSFEEKFKQKRIPVTDKERMFYSRNDKIVYEPTGFLRFRVKKNYGLNARDWCEDQEKPIESLLHDVIIGMLKEVSCERAREDERSEESRRRELEKQHREENEKIRLQEKERRDKLIHDTKSWIQARQIRAYVRHIIRSSKAGEIGNLDIEKWETWALSIADQVI